jgi:hypothetical protein
LTCCILYTLGYDCRLALGNFDYKLKNEKLIHKRLINHAFGLLFENEYDTNPYVIETTGTLIVNKLKKIDDCPEYYT